MAQQQPEGTAPTFRAAEVGDEQAWFWTPEWQEGEREVSEQIRDGQLSPKFHCMDEISAYFSEAEGR